MDVSEMPTREEMVTEPSTGDANYRGDTIADPVGNAIRQKNAEHNQYPAFILNQFETSNVNIFGKPFPNNGEALRPNASYLDALYEMAEKYTSEEYIDKCIDYALIERQELADKIIASVDWMLCDESGLSREFRWNIVVAPFGQEAHKHHARRIITKHTYNASMFKSTFVAPDAVLPEWLANQEEKMLNAGREAGFYHNLARNMKQMHEMDKPLKDRKPFILSSKTLEYQIKLQTQSTADYYSKPRDSKTEVVSLDALRTQAIHMMDVC